MLLAIDVGNTQTVLGLYEADSGATAADTGLVDHWRIRTDHDRTSDEHAVLIRNLLRQSGLDLEGTITGVAMCAGNNFDVISADGEFLGGAIAPGVEVSLDALFGRASALRAVELVEPRSVIGKSTVESLQSGAVYGFAAQIDGMVERFREELGGCTVVATGGLAHLIAPSTSTIEHVEPFLTLHGLRLVHERNR